MNKLGKHWLHEKGSAKGFVRCKKSAIFVVPLMRKWRNWQTHHLEGVAPSLAYGFKSRLPHMMALIFDQGFFYFPFETVNAVMIAVESVSRATIPYAEMIFAKGTSITQGCDPEKII